MEFDQIVQELNRRFAAPLPEFYKRRIVVWIDEEGEFRDKIDAITLENVKVAALDGANNFTVKKLLAVDDPTSNYLVYRPFPCELEEDNWLLDVELYSEEFRADLATMLMEELGVPQTPALRLLFKEHRKFFDKKALREKIFAQSRAPKTPAQVYAAMMAALADAKDAAPSAIIRAVLRAELELRAEPQRDKNLFDGNEENQGENGVYRDFVDYGINGVFWRMVEQATGYQADRPELARLARHILLTAATSALPPESLSGLREFISPAHKAFCYEFVSDWSRDDLGRYYAIAKRVENELELSQLFSKLEIADLVDSDVFPCVDEVVLEKLATDIKNGVIDVETITQIVEKRRSRVWYDHSKNYYECVRLVAKMRKFLNDRSDAFHTVEPAKVWKEYETDYYLMDVYYREFQRNYSATLTNYVEKLNDLFTEVANTVEGLYSAFLNRLDENWFAASADELRESGRIEGVPQQTDFYRRYVASSDSKVYVVISDALRYEVAATLKERLERETQAKVELNSMQALFPTITKFGMAATLPHKKLSVELTSGKGEKPAVLVDGESSESNNRDKLLKAADPASVALKYKTIIDMKVAERRELVKGMNVVYIYHDTIDDAGHHESFDFTACDAAINELKNMVRIIVNEWGGTNVVITADHGFLYTRRPLAEDGKLDKTTESEQDVEIGRRYAIMRKGASPQYMLPVKFLDGQTDFDAFAPRGNVRIKMKGGGLNFVHGGASLQETVTPVIKYHYLRNQSKEYKKNKSKYDTKPVEIGLVSANTSASRKISNMVFALNFYQKEPVSGNREAATYRLYFTDSQGKDVSDVQKIIADKTDADAQKRTFRLSFKLKQLKYSNTEVYALVIEDETRRIKQSEEFQIDIPLAVDEFDFFG